MPSVKDGRESATVIYPGERPPELNDWVSYKTKGVKEKFKEKVKQNPFVPLGCALTVAALTLGLFQFGRGQSKKSQLMMRFRVGAQAFTIGAVILGVAIQAFRGTNSYTPEAPINSYTPEAPINSYTPEAPIALKK